MLFEVDRRRKGLPPPPKVKEMPDSASNGVEAFIL